MTPDMPRETKTRTAKADKLLKQVLGLRFTLDGSQAELDRLDAIANGSYRSTKSEDPIPLHGTICSPSNSIKQAQYLILASCESADAL